MVSSNPCVFAEIPIPDAVVGDFFVAADVEKFVKSHSLTEAALVDHLSPSASLLPPLWSVIYEEAVRGNHILFETCELDTLQNATMTEFDDADVAWVVTYVAKQSVKTSLIELKQAVKDLPDQKRGLVFLLYMNSIQYFTQQLKRSLN